ncbi:succinylglutamate desuccinylase/aspartoacylase family protein [Pelagovum pacificum]|uniref:Succinylglutamate desuccinylase/aspartoacylase family protein n=1 Tax=Pelagovum pacificum TaxID=2588711 RepID=A0A5C5GFU5_9RHOB|nr:succinylglutamate desuccinylase/aspartoacylase family protein [Pelagovum pacificum]QQA43238.1 succinylglutamate desuccinylase/aspartoacylase family protein [Pelagovum pacificum]TNY33622.1 succinylglutamate desuccinylase/aspartoacylase family protein [Pelagovum pacificum]
MAKRASFEIGGETVAPGTRKVIDLPVSVMSDHTPVHLSVEVIHGRQPGPTVFVSAAVHGDEVIGVEIARRLLKSAPLRSLRGTLLVVPIVNSFGFLNHSRYLPDRRDLNRSFPGHAQGSLASRLANLFLTEIVLRCDFGIDLHSAAVHRTNLPQIRVTPGVPRLRQLASAFGPPVIINSPVRSGSLRAEAKAKGVDILLYEAGEGLRFDEMAVRSGVAGILRVLNSCAMLPDKGISRPRAAPLLAVETHWLRAPRGGLLRTFRGDGEIVSEGTVMAAVSGPFGNTEAEILAPFDGLVVGRAVMPVVNEGDAVFHLAQVARPDAANEALEDMADHLSRDPLFDEDEII